MQSNLDTLHSKANSYHVSIRNGHKTMQQNQIREKNKQFMKTMYRKIIVEDLSPDSIIYMLSDQEKSVQLETWIIETGYQHVLFQQLMKVHSLQGKSFVLKGIINILQKSLKSCSRLLEDSSYTEFLFNQLKQIQFCNVVYSVEYLDNILETIACLTCVQNIEFNYYLQDMKVIEFLGNKIRTQFQINFDMYDQQKMKNRVKTLLVIMQNLFFSEDNQQVLILFLQVIKQLSESSQFYKICPVNLLAVFRQIISFKCDHRQKITYFFSEYQTHNISHLQQYYHHINKQQQKQLTIQILKIIPLILTNRLIPQKDIFKNQEQLLELFLNVLDKSEDQIRKIAWKQMSTIIIYLRPSLISKQSHYFNWLLNTLLKQLNSQSYQIQESIQCLNSLIIFDLSQTQIFNSAISKGIIQLISNIVLTLEDQQLLNQIIALLHRIVVFGEENRSNNVFELIRQSNIQQNIQTTIFYSGKQCSKIAQQLHTKIEECLNRYLQSSVVNS